MNKPRLVQIGDPDDAILHEDLRGIRTSAAAVEKIKDDVIELCRKHEGAGIAAPQMGFRENFFFMDGRQRWGISFVINPRIVRMGRARQTQVERCLSVPSSNPSVNRALLIDVMYEDINGEPWTNSLRGFAARVFLHEYDHLRGVLITDDKVNGTTYESLRQPVFGPVPDGSGGSGVAEE